MEWTKPSKENAYYPIPLICFLTVVGLLWFGKFGFEVGVELIVTGLAACAAVAAVLYVLSAVVNQVQRDRRRF